MTASLPHDRAQDAKEEGADVETIGGLTKTDYSGNYFESTKETLVGLYSKRVVVAGETVPVESVNDIIWRVAASVAMAELRYALTPEQIIQISIDDALKHPKVQQIAKVFAECIGKQIFWANTPANINADPEVSLKVLQYEAHGKLAWEGANIAQTSELEMMQWIWQQSEEKELPGPLNTAITHNHWCTMKRLAKDLKGKGTLAACGVTSVTDSLDSIQEAARVETIAAKCAMGMGVNTSRIRPWSTSVANGAVASGPDRFYEKTISKSVEAIAQGGRRGGALIELRNSDHPDILFFIDKKALHKKPRFAAVLREVLQEKPGISMREATELAEDLFGQRSTQYYQRQDYLKNTNVTVLAMPGFMEAVKQRKFYRAQFNGAAWNGPIYDPHFKMPGVNKLTKESIYERYTVDLDKYPESVNAVLEIMPEAQHVSRNNKDKQLFVPDGYLYAPDVMARIVEGMRTCGEPGMMFYDLVNDANANDHQYDLDTCNPCGEQCLPSSVSKQNSSVLFAGTCNLSSMHAMVSESEEFANLVYYQQRFMDNVTDVSWYPLAAQNFTARAERRNGGGFAGVAEYLSRKHMRFGSPEALDLVKKLYNRYVGLSYKASQSLALERGVYPLYEGSKFEKAGVKVRNSCACTNAPTGTLAQALQTTWGVDPHYGIVFSRKVRSRFVDFTTPGFKDAMQSFGAWPDTEEGEKELMQMIRVNNKSCRGLAVVPPEVQELYPIKSEVTPLEYILHLGAVYSAVNDGVLKYMMNSVSNTCAIPEDSPTNDIYEALRIAHEIGVKALTFYPDGCRVSQPVEQIAEAVKEEDLDLLKMLGRREDRKIAMDETTGRSYKVPVGTPEGVSTLHVSLNESASFPGELVEIYARMGKSGAIEGGLFEAIGRLASSFLQYAAKHGCEERAEVQKQIVKQLADIQSGHPMYHKFSDEEKARVLQSPCDALAQLIQRHEAKSVNTQSAFQVKFVLAKDPLIASAVKRCKCGGDLIRIEGCYNCPSCGFSKC